MIAFSLPENPPVQAVVQQNNVEVAAVYDHYFGLSQGLAPLGWIKVGTVLGEDEVPSMAAEEITPRTSGAASLNFIAACHKNSRDSPSPGTGVDIDQAPIY